MTVTPQQIVECARSWVDVPFVHQGRTRAGVDCAGLLIAVGRELGLLPVDFDVPPYGPQPDGVTLRALCSLHLQPAGVPVLGGVVLVAWAAGPPQHLAILGDYAHGPGLTMIHADARRARRVVEQQFVPSRAMRLIAAYRLPGVA